MPKFYFDGRRTGHGAYTTAHGSTFNASKTGNHWTEVVEANVGDIIKLTDISNTGKHQCRIYRVGYDGLDRLIAPELKPEPHLIDVTTEYRYDNQPDVCPVCDREIPEF